MTSSTSSAKGVVFGLFAVYFLYRKKLLWLFFSLFLVILTGKRAAIAGFIPAAVAFFFLIPVLYKKRGGEAKWLREFVFFLYFLAIVLAGFFTVELASFVIKVYAFINNSASGIDASSLLIGRQETIHALRPEVLNSQSITTILGHGAGQADMHLTVHQSVNWADDNMQPTNPHNDILKIGYDYGILGLLCFYLLSRVLFFESKIGGGVFLFWMPVLLFDNTLVFTFFLLPMAAMIRTATVEE